MGRASGERKARSSAVASAAARKRWGNTPDPKGDLLKQVKQLQKQINELEDNVGPRSLDEELAQEAHRRKFVRPLAKKKPIKKKFPT